MRVVFNKSQGCAYNFVPESPTSIDYIIKINFRSCKNSFNKSHLKFPDPHGWIFFQILNTTKMICRYKCLK